MKKKSNPNRSSGVLLHITSLPGPYGIGEIGIESKRFVDNLVSMGQDYWQILPTNYPEPVSYTHLTLPTSVIV